MRIMIKVPTKGKWVVNNHYRRANANTVLKLTERLISKAIVKEKTCVRVNYGNGYNETLKSTDLDYLMFVTACFLEDYLSTEALKKYEKSI